MIRSFFMEKYDVSKSEAFTLMVEKVKQRPPL